MGRITPAVRSGNAYRFDSLDENLSLFDGVAFQDLHNLFGVIRERHGTRIASLLRPVELCLYVRRREI